ncbi:MAG: VENN motif pre-toxin domain-containing protein [Enterobacter sp.]
MVARAILGGAVAALQGNSAAAGAAGAATGELAAKAIAGMLYPDVKDLSTLSEEQKQTVSALATISAGMAGGLAGDSTGSATAGAQGGKNAAENNSLALVARGCAVAAPCRTKVAEQLLEIGVKAGITGAVAKTLADKLTADELDHLVTLEMMGNDEITSKYLNSLQNKYGSGSASNPNIGKDLTDGEKAELGGAGSGTGTPPPPENDPKQQNEKPVEKLNQKQESAIKKIDNTIKNALKDHDITGTIKDMDGNPVPKENGGYWDHMQEMQNTLRGLRYHADTLKNVNNPEAQAAYSRATDAINKIESALKGHGI